MKPLPLKRQRFVEEYLLDFNAAAAARRAGYSERTAQTQGPRLLRFVQVQAALLRLQQKADKRFDVRLDQVLGGLAKEAMGQGPDTRASARVAAWQAIARIKGFDAPKKVELTGADGGAIALDHKWTEEEVWARFERALDGGGAVESGHGAGGTGSTNGKGAG